MKRSPKGPRKVKKAEAEHRMEEYLRSRGLPKPMHEPGDPKTGRNPDYLAVLEGDVVHVLEVKQFESSREVKPGFYYVDETRPVRGKIMKARGQFKTHKDRPCVLVLWNVNALVFLEDPSSVFGAMHGDPTFVMPFYKESGLDTSEMRVEFRGGGPLSAPGAKKPVNTTFSALATLRYINVGLKRMVEYLDQFPSDSFVSHFQDDVPFVRSERGLGVVVFENQHARIPLSREVLSGPYDERFILTEDGIKRIFAGARVIETEEIDERRKPAVAQLAKEMLTETEKRAPRTGVEMKVGEEALGIGKDAAGR